MKREELAALGLNEEQTGKVMALHGADIERHKGEAQGLREQLAEAGRQIEAFKGLDVEGVKRAAAEWEEKYRALEEESKKREARRTAEAAADGLRFSSQSARRAFLAELEEKGLPAQDGKLLGFEEFVRGYRERDAEAFLPETPPPRAVGSTPGAQPGAGDAKAQANGALRALFGRQE